jgi:tRNA nucleotidyltransferase/poly(A) polymerase
MRRAEIRDLSRRLARRGERAWIVGGAPRDLILGRPVVEIDVAVSGDAEALAREMERAGLGRSVPLSSCAPRVFRVAGRREIDLAELEGASIERDLARRDFTVNAIALEIPAGVWLDPFGGIADLAARRLRVVRAANLLDDPARVLRAARFRATHQLRPDAATSLACRRAAKALSGVAPERLRVEIVKLLEAERAAPALAWAARVQALAPALGASPAAARRLARALPVLDRGSIRQLAPPARRRARLALIATALGLSPSETSRWLASRRFSRKESADVGTLLGLVREALGARSDRQKWNWVREAGPRAGEGLALFALLNPGERTRARELRSRAERASRVPRVRGSDLLDWLGIPPGPRVGALLRELELESLRGAIRTRREARSWLKNRIRRP